MECHILPLSWPAGSTPMEFTNIETQARKLRYRALGSTCKDLGLQTLMTAHHSDDQAETYLMRIASRHTGFSFHGIKSSGQLPECWGMHGVHQSGQYEAAQQALEQIRRWKPMHSPALQIDDFTRQRVYTLQRISSNAPVIERGGVALLRPLLCYEKGKLIGTCESEGILWEEDKTNAEVWHTPRNAVRSLFSSGKLPQALDKGSLSALGRRSKYRLYLLSAFFHRLEHECEVKRFDLRSGVLIIRFIKRIRPAPTSHVHPKTLPCNQIAARILEAIMSSVTPLESIDLEGLKTAAEAIFADFESLPSANPDQSVIFTAGGVKFQRIHSPVADATVTCLNRSLQDKPAHTILDPDFVWSLSRQPFPKERPAIMDFPTPCPDPNAKSVSKPEWTPWQLWDGRYWIRLKNLSKLPVYVRPFVPTDLEYIKAMLPKDTWRAVHDLLAKAAPGKIRWTLPAVVQTDEDRSLAEKILSLPSLGERGNFEAFGQEKAKLVDCEIRYKHVTLRAPSLDGNSRATEGFTNIRHHPELLRSWEASAHGQPIIRKTWMNF